MDERVPVLEARGIGVVEMPFAETVPVVLAVELGKRVERMPKHGRFVPPGLRLAVGAQPAVIACHRTMAVPA